MTVQKSILNIVQVDTVDGAHVIRFIKNGDTFTVTAGEGNSEGDYFEQYCTSLSIKPEALKKVCELAKRDLRVVDANNKQVTGGKSGVQITSGLHMKIPDSRSKNTNYAKVLVGDKTVNLIAMDKNNRSINEDLDLTVDKDALIEAIESAVL